MTTKLTIANLDTSLSSILPVVTTVSVCDAGGTVSSDLALRPAGGFLKISGSNFITGCVLYVNGSPATATTVISPTEVRVQMPALAVGTYSVMLFNTSTIAAIWVAGVIYSAAPVWSTTSYSNPGNVVSVQLVAAGDAPLVYSLASGTLPVGVTLSSTGLLSGTATAITVNTTVTFTVSVSDAQLQSTPQLISLSMTFYIGKLYSWGANSNGQLGQGDTTSRSSPVQVGALDNWLTLASGAHNIATKTDGTLWSWGSSVQGMLGLGDTNSRSSPVQVGSLTDWSTISLGIHTAAIKTNGTLWIWGNNNVGQLGLGDTLNRSSPVQIGALTTWAKISLAGSHSVAIKTDGTLWIWGWNAFAQLGLSDANNRSSPVQVGALTNWSKIATGGNMTIAVKTDGTLWAWGYNLDGQVGDGTTVNKNSPVQIGSLTNWSASFAGIDASGAKAIKTDGTFWTWGSGAGGANGDGTTISRSSPVQVGLLTGWSSAAGGSGHTVAISS